MKKSAQARKVVTRSPKRKVGLINCRWFQNSPIEHESQLEKRFVYSAMLCPGVREIKSQPFKLKLETGSYTPDFLIDFGHSKAVIEVKVDAKVPAYGAKFNSVQRALAAKGVAFYVVTEKGIDRGRLAHVAIEVLRYAKAELPMEGKLSLLRRVQAGTETTLAVLKQTAGVTQEMILHLVAIRWLRLHQGDMVEDHARISHVCYSPEQDFPTFEKRFQVKPWDPLVPLSTESSKEQRKRSVIPKRPASAGGPYVREHRRDTAQVIQNQNPLSVIAGGLPLPPIQTQVEPGE